MDKIIISFCNFDYVRLAQIWVDKLIELNIDNYIIISADNKAYIYLKSHNIKTELVIKDDKESFWIYRMRIIIKYLNNNKFKYIIHSDLDAIFKKNIFDGLFEQDMDLYFSQGTIFPKDVLDKHKFVLCCGFFCIKSNNKTKSFFNKYFIKLLEIKDDQMAINKQLINTKWIYSNNDIVKKNRYIYFRKDIIGYNKEYDLNIELISFFKIQREYINNNGYIYHILSPKVCDPKIKLFEKLKII